MENFLSKFLASLRGWFIAALIIACLGGLFCLCVNQMVKRFVPSLAALTADRLKIKVSIDKVRYVFPRQIFLEGMTVSSADTPNQLMFKVPKMILDFSFPFLTKKERIHLEQVILSQTNADVPEIKNYLLKHGTLLWGFLRTLPANEMKLSFNQTKIYLFRHTQTVDPLLLDIDFTLSQGQFSGKLKDSYSFLQYWGNWQDNRVNLKGYMFYKGPLASEPLYVLDIDALLLVKAKDLLLKKLSFSVNGDQVLATGHFLLDIPFKFDANVLYRRQLRHITTLDPLKTMEASLNGGINAQGVLVSGKTKFDLYSNSKLKMLLERVDLEFKDLKTAVINDRLLQVKTSQAAMSLVLNNRTYKITFERFLASIKYDQRSKWMASLSTQMYGGKYQGQIIFDIMNQPWKIESYGNAENIQIERLVDLTKYFSRCKGSLSGAFHFKNLSLTANLSLHDGEFEDFSFFPVAVSKMFQMPSLDHLSNTDVTMRLIIDRESANIEDFKLHSNNIKLQGSFRLDSNNLIFSRMSVLFPKDVLMESPVGQKIIQLVPQAWFLPFEFHLSGDVQRMNFQWDDSPLKRKVEERLPHFVERSIEQRIDQRVSI